MKITVAILIAIVLVLAWQLSAEVVTTRLQRSEIATLTSKLADKSARENLELQEKCAQQAAKMFEQLGYKLDRAVRGVFATYQSHFNANLGKCLMTLNIGGAATGDQRHLFDAYEQRGYAEYMTTPGQKYRERPPHCRLTPSSGKETPCKSEEEYETFVAIYME